MRGAGFGAKMARGQGAVFRQAIMVEQRLGHGRVEAVGAAVRRQAQGGTKRIAGPAAAQIGQAAPGLRQPGGKMDQGRDLAVIKMCGAAGGIPCGGMGDKDGRAGQAGEDGPGLRVKRRGRAAPSGQVDGVGIVTQMVQGGDQPVPAPGAMSGAMDQQQVSHGRCG